MLDFLYNKKKLSKERVVGKIIKGNAKKKRESIPVFASIRVFVCEGTKGNESLVCYAFYMCVCVNTGGIVVFRETRVLTLLHIYF